MKAETEAKGARRTVQQKYAPARGRDERKEKHREHSHESEETSGNF